ncbi:MAG: hypothetical protein LAO03_17050 [Acidobacteriia bacterium]|nr:hypothetical protein [Terriglobia bacterium]
MHAVRLLAQEYGADLPDERSCLVSSCAIKIGITNEELARFSFLPLPRAALGVAFFINKGRTVHLGLELLSERRGFSYYFQRLIYGNADEIVSVASVEDDSNGSEYYDVGDGYKVLFGGQDAGGHPKKVVVHLTPNVDAIKRNEAFDLNLHCLSWIWGCRDASELLPAVWKNAHHPGSEVLGSQVTFLVRSASINGKKEKNRGS